MAEFLRGAPVGGPGGLVLCDSCNKGLTELPADAEPVARVDEVNVYLTTVELGANKWMPRWLNCEECGPVGGDGEVDEPGEAHVTASLMFDHTLNGFVLVDVDVLAVAPAAETETEVA